MKGHMVQKGDMLITGAGYKTQDVGNGSEFECAHPGSAEITCEECIINGGDMSPISGKPFKGNLANYKALALERYGYRDDSPEELLSLADMAL